MAGMPSVAVAQPGRFHVGGSEQVGDTPRIGRRRCNEAGWRIVRSFEGFRAHPYVCPAGVWTIGYGATRGTDGNAINRTTSPIDQSTADALLDRDIVSSEAAVARLLPVPMTDNQFSALVSFTFNLGAGALQRSTLRQVILRGDHGAVPRELAKWVRGGGRVLPGLVRRRSAEALLYQA